MKTLLSPSQPPSFSLVDFNWGLARILVLGALFVMIPGCASNGNLKGLFSGTDSLTTGHSDGSEEGDTRRSNSRRERQPVIAVDEPTLEEPVQAGMLCLPTENDGLYELWLRIKTHEGFYLHARDASHDDPNALAVDIDLPEGAEPIGAVDLPRPTVEHDLPVYRGDLIAVGKFKWQGIAPENLVAKVRFQACSDSACLPPEQIELSQTIKP